MSTVASSTKYTEQCTILGPEQLLIRAVRTPETMAEREKAINDALQVYVASRLKLESDRSGPQWNVINEDMNTVLQTLTYVGECTVVQGNALWKLPPELPTRVPVVPDESLSSDKDKNNERPTLPTATLSTAKPRPTRKITQPRPKSSAPSTSIRPIPSKNPKSKPTNDIEQWKKFESCLPPPDAPSIEWLTNVRNIVAAMGVAYQSKAHARIDAALWCQLVFLNVHRAHARTLNGTRVCKIDISDWDLVPTEAEEPCKTCGSKIPCQWASHNDISKCRECHLQAKRCVPGGVNVAKTPRKRRRASQSPLPPPTRRRLFTDEDIDGDEDEVEEDEDENGNSQGKSSSSKNPGPTKVTKPSSFAPRDLSTSNDTIRPRPTLNVKKPMVIIPKQSINWPDPPTSSTLMINPAAQIRTTSVPSPQTQKGKARAVPNLQLLMEQSMKIAETVPEGSAFDTEPDPEEVSKIMAGLADLDREGYKQELAKTIVKLRRVLKRNELIIEGIKMFTKKEAAYLVALKRKEEDVHKTMMEMLNHL